MHLGWIRNEGISRTLDLRDKKSYFGGVISVCPQTRFVTCLAFDHSFGIVSRQRRSICARCVLYRESRGWAFQAVFTQPRYTASPRF